MSGVPGVGWRTTTTSAPMASMFLAVSMNDSPFDRLDPLGEKSCVSAESRLAARLKLVRVLRRILEEQVEYDPALQGRHLLAAARRDLGKRLRGIEHGEDLLGRKLLEPQQVLARRTALCSRRPRGDAAAVTSCSSWMTVVWGSAAILTISSTAIDRRQPHPHVSRDDRS